MLLFEYRLGFLTATAKYMAESLLEGNLSYKDCNRVVVVIKRSGEKKTRNGAARLI